MTFGSIIRGFAHYRTVLTFCLWLGFLGTLSAQVFPGTGTQTEPPTEPVAKDIEANDSARPSDDQIQARLAEIYANLSGLQGVSVTVNDGVVVLSGTVDDSEAMVNAKQLADRVSGAVIVVNNITRDRTIGTRLHAATESIKLRLRELLGNAPLLLLALLVVGVAVWVSRLAVKAEWLFVRMSANSFVRDLLRQIAQLAIVFCGVVIALQLLDATALLGSLVGALGIIGLALGFATRDTVENYIASLLLSLRQPFRSEDYVSIDGVEGKVLRLTPRATVLMSLAGNHLRIPNARVYKATITNFTRNPLRRFEFAVGVDTDIELNLPRELAVKTVSDIPGVLENPAAQCLVEALGDSSVILRTFAWIDQRETDYLKVRSEAQQRVKEAFDVAGVVMPEPVYNVNLRRRRSADVRPGPAPAPQTAPAPEESGNTARDSTVEDQMRKEQRQSNEEDLLSGSAPTE